MVCGEGSRSKRGEPSGSPRAGRLASGRQPPRLRGAGAPQRTRSHPQRARVPSCRLPPAPVLRGELFLPSEGLTTPPPSPPAIAPPSRPYRHLPSARASRSPPRRNRHGNQPRAAAGCAPGRRRRRRGRRWRAATAARPAPRRPFSTPPGAPVWRRETGRPGPRLGESGQPGVPRGCGGEGGTGTSRAAGPALTWC